MNLKQLFFARNACYIAGKVFAPIGIMVHSTGANNPNLKRYVGPDDGLLGANQYGNHWNVYHPGGKDIGAHTYKDANGDGTCDVCGGRQVCVHGFIGKLADGTIATYQNLPWNYRGWHAGKTAGNDRYISFEICEDALSDAAYFGKVYQEAVELCAYLCKESGFNPLADGVLICHSEGYKRGIASNHGDVMHWFPKHGKSMDTFRVAVKTALDALNASGGTTTPATPETPATGTEEATADTLYRVQVGAYSKRANADATEAELRAKGYDTYMVQADGLYKVQVGAYAKKANADAMAAKLKADGFDTYITTNGGTAASTATEAPAATIYVGSSVKVKQGATTYDGKSLASFVYTNTYNVIQITGERVVIGKGQDVTAAVNMADLMKA